MPSFWSKVTDAISAMDLCELISAGYRYVYSTDPASLDDS